MYISLREEKENGNRKTERRILPNRCYVLGGLSALNLI